MKIHAQITNPIFGDNLPASGGIDFLGKLISLLINLFLVGAAILFIIYFILGGYTWITSGGDKQKIQDAQKRITSAVIGLIVIFLIFVILRLLGTLFGIEGLKNLQLIIPTL